jgi:predicted transcriptional regulator
MSWDDVSYVVRSKTRRNILLALRTPKTPTILAQELHTSLPNVSRALRELEAKSLIDLITPKARLGKIYKVTDKGTVVSGRIDEMKNK